MPKIRGNTHSGASGVNRGAVASKAEGSGRRDKGVSGRSSQRSDGVRGMRKRQMQEAGRSGKIRGKGLSARTYTRKFPSKWDNFSRKMSNWFSKQLDIGYSGEKLKTRQRARAKKNLNAESGNLLKAMRQGNADGIKSAWENMIGALDSLGVAKEGEMGFTKDAFIKGAMMGFINHASDDEIQALYNVPDKDLVGAPSKVISTIMQGAVDQIRERGLEVDLMDADFRIACYASPFQDEALRGDMKVLGSGAVSTVYSANYKGVDPTMVFKADDANISGLSAPNFAGIPKKTPNLSQRSVASSKLDEKLGFNVVVKTNQAMHDGVRGIVMERAKGMAQVGNKEVITDMDERTRAALDNLIKFIGDIEYDANGNPVDKEQVEMIAATVRAKGIRMIDGELKLIHDPLVKINHTDPVYQQSMMMMQLEDAITGQVDRHLGNYVINVDANGMVQGAKGIDNDFSFGHTIQSLNDIDSRGGLHIVRFPHVVDTEMFAKIMDLSDVDIDSIMSKSFTPEEIDAAKSRLSALKSHLLDLQNEGCVIDPAEWGSPRANELLAIKEPFSDGKGESWTSYIQRDKDYLVNYTNTPGRFVVSVQGDLVA